MTDDRIRTKPIDIYEFLGIMMPGGIVLTSIVTCLVVTEFPFPAPNSTELPDLFVSVSLLVAGLTIAYVLGHVSVLVGIAVVDELLQRRQIGRPMIWLLDKQRAKHETQSTENSLTRLGLASMFFAAMFSSKWGVAISLIIALTPAVLRVIYLSIARSARRESQIERTEFDKERIKSGLRNVCATNKPQGTWMRFSIFIGSLIEKLALTGFILTIIERMVLSAPRYCDQLPEAVILRVERNATIALGSKKNLSAEVLLEMHDEGFRHLAMQLLSVLDPEMFDRAKRNYYLYRIARNSAAATLVSTAVFYWAGTDHPDLEWVGLVSLVISGLLIIRALHLCSRVYNRELFFSFSFLHPAKINHHVRDGKIQLKCMPLQEDSVSG